MRASRALVVLSSVLAFVACNQVLGIQDVQPKKSSSSSKPRTSSNDDDDSDDDDLPGGTSVTGNDAGQDAGVVVRPPCNGVIACERLVFVTHATFTGDLGGLDGADQKCTEAAKAIPGYGGRQFRAWLSDDFTDASSRIPQGVQPFRRLDQSVLASSYADLTDGSIAVPFALDETGAPLQGSTFDVSVWTATDPTGLVDSDNCFDWTSEEVTDSGGFGDSQATDGSWTEEPGEPVAVGSCDAQKHLYCVEY